MQTAHESVDAFRKTDGAGHERVNADTTIAFHGTFDYLHSAAQGMYSEVATDRDARFNPF